MVGRRARFLVVLAGGLLVAALVGLNGQPWAAVARDQPPTGPPASVGPALAPFVGVWERRDAWLWVGRTGTARLRWRTEWCDSTTREPCDRDEGGVLTIGAVAEMTFTDVAAGPPLVARGRVTGVNTPGPLQPGSVVMVQVDRDLIELRQAEQVVQLCRAPRDPNTCDDPSDYTS
jgi:hypothetical protein